MHEFKELWFKIIVLTFLENFVLQLDFVYILMK